MFTPSDILALVNAGFTAQQIAGLSMIQNQTAQPVVQAPVQPVVQAPVQPVVQAPAQPIVQAPAQPVVQDPVLAELQKLTGLVQSANIIQSAQPKVQTPEEILAEIINPAPKGDK